MDVSCMGVGASLGCPGASVCILPSSVDVLTMVALRCSVAFCRACSPSETCRQSRLRPVLGTSNVHIADYLLACTCHPVMSDRGTSRCMVLVCFSQACCPSKVVPVL